MIGHCCDHLVEGLNCLVSTCWLIEQPRLCSSTVVVIVDQGQDQEQVQIEMELDVINVGNMIILQRIALPPKKKER